MIQLHILTSQTCPLMLFIKIKFSQFFLNLQYPMIFLTEDLVNSRMMSVIWGDERMPAVRGKHWDIRFYPVENAPRKVSKHRFR